MKLNFLILSCLIFIISCKNDKDELKKDEFNPKVIISNITSNLAGADTINSFINSLKNLSLTEAETSQGITVFAPLNENNGAQVSNTFKSKSILQSVSPIVSLVPDSVLRDHIVKGVYKFSDLNNGKVLVGLSGKSLTISRSGDIVKINGVLISGKEIFSGKNEVVFAVKESLTPVDSIAPPDTIEVIQELTEPEFLLAKQNIENDLGIWHKNLVIMDGVLSHDASLDSISNIYKNTHRELSNFTFNTNHQVIFQFWNKGYQIISIINLLEKKIPTVLSNRNENLAQVKVMRAYVYLQLLNYFGNIPLAQNLDIMIPPTNINTKQNVYNFIKTELESVESTLPLQNSSMLTINGISVKTLLAKVALFDKDYLKVSQYTEAILNSGIYSLSDRNNIFTNDSKEIIWNHSASVTEPVRNYFFNHQNLPYLRLTEVYLMNIEANLQLGNTQKAQSALNTFLSRHGDSGTANMNTLRTLWLSEMRREGSSYINLIRWDTATSRLGTKGFTAKNKLLPIPQVEVDRNATIVQNPGY